MPLEHQPQTEVKRVLSGIAGLDNILGGGFPPNRLYVIEGNPGAGKTTLALQFLLEGMRNRESVLYITLSETADELHEVAESHGWSLEGIHLLELGSLAERLQDEADYTIYHPADVELGEITGRIREEAERVNPSRVALDSASEFRILSQTTARYRREILSFKHFFVGKGCTVLVVDDPAPGENEQQLQSIAHGVIRMERTTRDYGATRRQIQIVKMRAVQFREGLHDFIIRKGGIDIFPRLIFHENASGKSSRSTAPSGVKELDLLLGSGLDCGSSTLILGPTGCGKTTLSSQFLIAALNRGEAAACYLFDESRETFLQRSSGLGMQFEPHIASGLFELIQIDPAEISPGEFASQIARTVETRNARMVVIDSINGYVNTMPSEHFLLIQLHELLAYLGQKDIITILIMAQQGLLGGGMQSPTDISFLADTAILLRYFEAMGEIRQAVSVVKKRRGTHERTIREMHLGAGGVLVGAPLREFEGVLTGVPRYGGPQTPLLPTSDE